jgi:beta-glucosidase
MSGAAPDLAALLARMTLVEKLGQLSLSSVEVGIENGDPVNPLLTSRTPDERLEDIRAGRVTGIFNALGVKTLLPLQRAAVEESRLGIPLLFAADIIHGCRTIFPVPLAEAAAWDPDLARRTAESAAREAAAEGIAWTFAPGVDVARDARWGRVVESSGEDVRIACLLARARVAGYQGTDLANAASVMATAKHFAGYGAAEGGLDYAAADISWRTMREHYLPPFHAAVESGVGCVMTAFNDFEGIPCTANARLLREILPDQWGFNGVVVSDFNSDLEMVSHGYAADAREAARLSLLAGLDMSMESGVFLAHGVDLVESGEVPISLIDNAVMRVLCMKQRLGLFANPYNRLDAERERHVRDDHAARALAREAATRSIVLLKRRAQVLPLAPGTKIALIGPFAADRAHLNGPWSLFGCNRNSVNVLDGLAHRFGRERITCVEGSAIEAPLPGGIDAAVACASEADVIVLVVGEGQHMSGECRSRADVSVPEPQMELARALRQCGKPMVALVRTGRPLALGWLAEHADALLVTWFLGSETGHAIADVLSGTAMPSGRLPISFPRHSGQAPLYYNRKATGRPVIEGEPPIFKTRYRDVGDKPLFPFGFGLGYGDVQYGPVEISRSRIRSGERIRASVRIENAGKYPCEELVQLYIRDVAASLIRPIRELIDFRRTRIEPGASAQVSFEFGEQELAFEGADGERKAESGEFLLWITRDAESGREVRFEFTREASVPVDVATAKAAAGSM